MIWTEESARLLERAYRTGSAVQTMLDWIVPRLNPDAHVCDAGCGVGALSRALTRHAAHVTAIDKNATAITMLQSSTDTTELSHMTILEGDIHAHQPQHPYDAMVFSFFGSIDTCLELAERQCRGDLFYISRNYVTHRFSSGELSVTYSGYREARARLDALGIPYEWRECGLDIGQPFEDFDEARRFFALYNRGSVMTDEQIRTRLTETPQAEYPLYMPHVRSTGMLYIRKQDREKR